MIKRLVLAAMLACSTAHAAPAVSDAATAAARYARQTYGEKVIDSLASMVSFNTVADEKVPFNMSPQHIGFKRFIKQEAAHLGLDFNDFGHVMVVGLGQGKERIGVITHGDVQPVDPGKWKQSPFKLDRSSEPGLLLGRGTEDDKGPIATAMYAMKAIKDRNVPLKKRIELYIYMAEESDWAPLEAFLKTHTPPQTNITIDAEYPAVTAEKGWGALRVTLPNFGAAVGSSPTVERFTGGFFDSQIPEDARAVIDNADAELEAAIRARASRQRGMSYHYSWQGKRLVIAAKGLSAHSSKPEDGVNAIAMLADALAVQQWHSSQAGMMVDFVNDMIGTGFQGEKFGKIAYADEFMGPMTVSPTTLKPTEEGLVLGINLRRPRGKTTAELTTEINAAFDAWKEQNQSRATLAAQIGEPWVQDNAPQLPTLMKVFSHYTGIKDPQPVAIGGGTNSRLFPHAVSFGPAMPGKVYTGHSEHEFITEKQLMLNLEMYTAVLVELAK
ncbi:dipeptidase [Pseudoduganella violaceinigra]|uniref:dipeptidase n=1 Tax=Pseudoduganella violaceinigra TaxID=246602 RepID=UPI00041B5E73|nr:dipeptidase [Pseudoduganella violaceinigra]